MASLRLEQSQEAEGQLARQRAIHAVQTGELRAELTALQQAASRARQECLRARTELEMRDAELHSAKAALRERDDVAAAAQERLALLEPEVHVLRTALRQKESEVACVRVCACVYAWDRARARACVYATWWSRCNVGLYGCARSAALRSLAGVRRSVRFSPQCTSAKPRPRAAGSARLDWSIGWAS